MRAREPSSPSKARSSAAALVGLLALALVLVRASPIAAQAPPDTARPVIVEGCEGLDAASLTARLASEVGALATMPPGSRPIVRVTCEDAGVRIDVEDPTTCKSVQRTVPRPPALRGAERALALAISELIMASWLEVLASTCPSAPPPAPAQREAVREVVRAEIAAPAEAPPAPRTGTRIDVMALGGATLRDTSTPLVLGSAALEATVWLAPEVGLALSLLTQHGPAERATGRVDVAIYGAAIGASLAPVPDARWLIFGVRARVQAASLQGVSTLDPELGRRLETALLDVVGRVEARFAAGALRIGGFVEVGAAVLGPVGAVDGEAPVRLPGGVISLALSIGVGTD